MSENPPQNMQRPPEQSSARTECRYPDFLCIGAQKAGTTWLDTNLRRHPRLWLPPIKELQYFNEKYLAEDKKWTVRHRREKARLKLQQYFANNPENMRDEKIVSTLHDIMEAPASDEWYGRIFSLAKPGQICGEITPEYSGLPEDGVKRVLHLSPEVKIILSLRDPIERSWSHMRMMTRTKNLPENPTLEQMALNPVLLRRSDYAGAIKTWTKFVPPERFLVIFMEDIGAQPNAVLDEVCAFLGVKQKEFLKAAIPIHVGDDMEMPDSVKEILKKRLRPVYDELIEFYPEQGKAWMARHYGKHSER